MPKSFCAVLVLPVVCNKKSGLQCQERVKVCCCCFANRMSFSAGSLTSNLSHRRPRHLFQCSSGRSFSSPIPAAILILTSHLNIFNALRTTVLKPEDIICGSIIHTTSIFPPGDNDVPPQSFHPHSPFAQRFLLERDPRQALFSCQHFRMQGHKNFGLPSTGFDNSHNTVGKTICHL